MNFMSITLSVDKYTTGGWSARLGYQDSWADLTTSPLNLQELTVLKPESGEDYVSSQGCDEDQMKISSFFS